MTVALLAGCGSDDASDASGEASASSGSVPAPPQRVEVRSPWVRPAPAGGNSALYMTLVNGTQTPDTLLQADVAAADTVEIHESYQKDDGVMGMRPIGPVPLAPKSNVALEPGGKHVMLIGLNRALEADSTVAVTVTFANAGARRLQAPIQMRPPKK